MSQVQETTCFPIRLPVRSTFGQNDFAPFPALFRQQAFPYPTHENYRYEQLVKNYTDKICWSAITGDQKQAMIPIPWQAISMDDLLCSGNIQRAFNIGYFPS
jgi:hypothetical protein